MQLHYRTLTDLAAAFRRRELSPVAVTEAMLERIEQLEPRLHAFVTVTADLAREQARQAEARLDAGGELPPLLGVPIGVKDLCDTAGIRTTAGMAIYDDRVPTTTATLVQRLLDAGAVLLGKLKTTEAAGGLHHPSVTPPVNPWNAGRWSGASSSGSGVATAAGLCFGSIGTDTAGSIRFPSAANGVVGLKPTFGRVPKDGVFPMGPSLDHPGPITRSVRDAARMLGVLAGPCDADPTTALAPVDDYEAEIDGGVRGLRIGIDERYCTDGVDGALAEAVLRAARHLESQGAELAPLSLPDMDAAVLAHAVIFHAEIAAVHAALYDEHAARYGENFAGLIETGRSLDAAEYARAHQHRLEFTGRLTRLLQDIDAIICPPAMTAPPPVELMQITPTDYRLMTPALRFTTPMSLAGVPTLTLPCGFTNESVPLGLQLVGAPFREARLLRIGQAYESTTDVHERHPDL